MVNTFCNSEKLSRGATLPPPFKEEEWENKNKCYFYILNYIFMPMSLNILSHKWASSEKYVLCNNTITKRKKYVSIFLYIQPEW